jgi:uncharacterized protein DUF3306
MSETAEGFLGRWSRRKAGRVEESPAPTPAPTPPSGGFGAGVIEAGSSPVVEAIGERATVPKAEAVELPTLADVAALTHSSDYSRFVLPGVEADVRNAAMRKLFSDPRFNVMDGLDTYIDDYGKPDPIPLAMLRRMNQSSALGLFADDEPLEVAAPAGATVAAAGADGSEPAEVAQSPGEPMPVPPAESHRVPDDDPDLRLQQDDADRRGGAGPGPRA